MLADFIRVALLLVGMLGAGEAGELNSPLTALNNFKDQLWSTVVCPHAYNAA
jgi:hypothetical protein